MIRELRRHSWQASAITALAWLAIAAIGICLPFGLHLVITTLQETF